MPEGDELAMPIFDVITHHYSIGISFKLPHALFSTSHFKYGVSYPEIRSFSRHHIIIDTLKRKPFSKNVTLRRKLFPENVTLKGKPFDEVVLLKGKKSPDIHLAGPAILRETPEAGEMERWQGRPSGRGRLRSVWPTGKSKATGQETFHSKKRS